MTPLSGASKHSRLAGLPGSFTPDPKEIDILQDGETFRYEGISGWRWEYREHPNGPVVSAGQSTLLRYVCGGFWLQMESWRAPLGSPDRPEYRRKFIQLDDVGAVLWHAVLTDRLGLSDARRLARPFGVRLGTAVLA